MAAQVGADRKEGRERKMLFDPDDPEYIKDLQRPAAIKEDLTEMERRKRVQQILESKEFCRELEEVIRQESDSARSDPDHLRTLQRLSELTLPHGQLAAASLHGIGTSSLPIADLKGIDKYGKVEKILRQKLASLYRLVDLFQWSQGIYNHITVRLPGDEDEILINPFGLLYHEITASSLIKVALDGSVLDPGSSKLGINNAGYVLHSAIHAARPDVQCVIHMHTAVVSAVSSMKCGLLPLCQEAMIIGPVAYHDYQGILDDESEKQSIVTDLGDKNVMILRNHGFVACGQSVEDALHLAFHTIIACETQILILRGNGFLVCGSTVEEAVYLTRNLIASADHQIRAARAGIENLVIPDEAAVQKAYKTARQGGGGVNRSPGKGEKGPAIVWGIGELEWEAWMRVLDNAGFRTGHIYRQPHLRQKTVPTTTNGHSDVAVPPAATAVGMVDESDPESLTAHKLAILRREQEKARWLNSPNSYQKIEILESGTDRPKVITKWVQDATSPCSNGTPVKIVSPHQFSPFGQNPKEFKDKQKAIKESRRMGATSAGPQSQILDGVTYEDLGLIKPVNGDGDSITGPADKIVLIGTASKGIIDRQHQHNAQVYRQLYAPNPFSTETDDDIKKYMQEVESKSPRATSARGSTLERSSEIPDISIYSNGKEHRADSPGAEHENGSKHDTASLMQAAREHRLREESCHEENAPTSQDISGRYTVETTFGSTDSAPRSRLVLLDTSNSSSSELSSPNSHFSPHRQFGRTTSARNRQLSSDTTISTSDSELSSHPVTEAKEEQSPAKSEKKKKKKGLLSFMKKNKDKKEKA